MKMCLLKGHNPLSINSSLYSFDNLFSISFLSSFLETQETYRSSSKLLFIESNKFGCILRINLKCMYCLKITFNCTSKSIKFSICVLDHFVISLYYSSKFPIVWAVDFFVCLFYFLSNSEKVQESSHTNSSNKILKNFFKHLMGVFLLRFLIFSLRLTDAFLLNGSFLF